MAGDLPALGPARSVWLARRRRARRWVVSWIRWGCVAADCWAAARVPGGRILAVRPVAFAVAEARCAVPLAGRAGQAAS